MTKIYIEAKDCITLIDGFKIENPITLNDGIYALTFIPYNESNFYINSLIIDNGHLKTNSAYISCLIKKDYYYIYFDSKKEIYSPQPISYYQQEICLEKTHYFTAYKQNENYFITLESENEIYNISTTNKLENITIKSSQIMLGGLIVIKADILKQKYINVILYDIDYHSIFNAMCDEIEIKEDGIILTDFVLDSMQRKITRYFSFKDNKYTETTREFQYLKRSSILQETLPFLFCEALFCQDYNFCKKYTSSEKLEDFISLIGKFDKIVNINDVYKKNTISLLYNEKSRSFIKNFNFDIQNLYIENIIEL